MPFTNNQEIVNIYDCVLDLVNGVSGYASGYAKQRMTEDLEYLARILEARSLMPIAVDNSDESNNEGNVNGNENEENNGTGDGTVPQAPQKLGFFEMIILAIINFFKMLFGLGLKTV